VTLRVVVADRLAAGGLDLLAQTPGIEVVNCAGKPAEELQRALEHAQALIVRSETKVTVDVMNRAPELRVIARAGIGVDTIDVTAATRRGIAVMNAPGANTVSAAEHALGLLLSLVRHIPEAAESMRRRSGRSPSSASVNPPAIAAATLSGCPSSGAARASNSSSPCGLPCRTRAAASPATIAALDEPVPAPSGTAFRIRNASPSSGPSQT